MISESLRPGPLPRRRLSTTEWLLLLLGIALMGAGFYKVGIPVVAVLIAALSVATVCVRKFEYTFTLLMGVSMSVSIFLLLDMRPTVGGAMVPVTILDFLGLLVLISFMLNLMGRRENLALPRHLILSYTLFVGVTFFALVYGALFNGGAMSTYLRDCRLFFILNLSILGVAWFIRSPKQLRLIACVLVLAAFSCACQQNFRLIANGSMGFGGIRDIGLPTQTLAMALAFLIIYRHHGIRLCPPNTYPFLISFLLLALLVSFTRTVWAMMIFSYALSLQYMGAKQRARSIFLAMGMFGLLVFVVPFALDLASHGMNLQSLIEQRYEQIMGKNDLAREARMVTTADAWLQYTRSPVIGLGIGFPIYTYDIEKRTTVEDTNLHNSPLFYAIKIGGVGLFILIWLIVAGLRRMARTASSRAPDSTPEQREIKAFAQSLFAAFVPFACIGIWSGNLNFHVFMPILGLAIGIDRDKLAALYPAHQPVAQSPALPETSAEAALSSGAKG